MKFREWRAAGAKGQRRRKAKRNKGIWVNVAELHSYLLWVVTVLPLAKNPNCPLLLCLPLSHSALVRIWVC